MANTSSRLTLNEIDGGTDSVSSWPALNNANMATLDNAQLYTEGTLVARPVASTVEHGHVYHATDTAQWFQSDGTNWGTILTAGQWSNLTLGSGCTTTSSYRGAPASRLEGDIVRFRGGISIPGGGLPAGQTIATAVAASIGNGGAFATCTYLSSGTWATASLGLSGTSIVNEAALAGSSTLYLDGVTVTIA